MKRIATQLHFPSPRIPARKAQQAAPLRNEYGTIVMKCWDLIPSHFVNVGCDEFIVMPNHFHGIIVIVGAQFIAPFDCDAINQNKKQGVINHAPTVGDIVRAFKARCTHMINRMRSAPGIPLWQRSNRERELVK
jgi:hypothetical protein